MSLERREDAGPQGSRPRVVSTPQVHGFLYARVPAGHRTRHEAERFRAAVEAAGRTAGVAAVYAYSLLGFRSDVDVGLWIAAEDADAYQEAVRPLFLADIEPTWNLWGFVRPSQYTGRDGTSVQVPGTRRRFLVVYPFTKTHAWYQLSTDVRRAVMSEHAKIGHRFEDIDQILLYCTGLADWEFVVGYETDDLLRFQELVTAMRSTAARPYTLRDTPTFTGRYGPLEDVLRALFG